MNRKEQIENLEAEIAQKQQTLSELRDAENNQDQDDIDITQGDIDDFISNVFN
ncbi:hypothetical protein SAMN05443549_101738 [Flavobacterium fluvii]|uniref:Uncharacterized protein n=1 Tax=Flavobacterium fluvii TaxID=468056 RepID=A0A1M5FDF1_9FLAO|nr:hypothetical protein [Flavobacterium fluvii]SHF89553.1 hypothetical protein SAMN05443549_101738 [Flavobacterium fluvii]